MSGPRFDKRSLDVSQIFLTYVALVGDVEKTAAALDLDPDAVRKLADSEGWDIKIKRVCLLSKTGRPGDFERAQHRALCFVQAHQIRGLIDTVVARMAGLTPDQIADSLSTIAKDGSRHISARFFADLTAAAEKAHQMGYAALGDTGAERKDRGSEENDEMNANALHAAVISALNNPSVKPLQVLEAVQAATDQTVKQLGEYTQLGVSPQLSENVERSGGDSGSGEDSQK